MTPALRALLVALAAVLTLAPADLTAAALLAALVVVVGVAASRPLLLATVAPVSARPTARRTMPLLKQAVVAGPGRPQPRAPGARTRASS